MTKKTQEKYNAILSTMQPNEWYKASEFEDIVGVKESRTKVLLKDLMEQGLIESKGSTKGKMYTLKTRENTIEKSREGATRMRDS